MLFLINRKILLIRPKKLLCDDSNYRESRYFMSWKKPKQIEDFFLPRLLQDITGQVYNNNNNNNNTVFLIFPICNHVLKKTIL